GWGYGAGSRPRSILAQRGLRRAAGEARRGGPSYLTIGLMAVNGARTRSVACPNSLGGGSRGLARRSASAQLRSNSSIPLGRTGGHETATVPSCAIVKSRITVPCLRSIMALLGNAFAQSGSIFLWIRRKYRNSRGSLVLRSK